MDEETSAEGAKKKKSLRVSVAEGSFASVMQSAFDQFIIPFAVVLNASVAQLGFIRAFPQLGSALVQLLVPGFATRFGSKKRIIVAVVAMQATMWVLLVATALWIKNVYALIFAATLIAVFGGFAYPLWSSWMGDLTSKHDRGRYFSQRNQFIGGVSFAAIIVFGLMLDHFEGAGRVFIGFAILFSIAMASRFISAVLLARMHEPLCAKAEESPFGFVDFLRGLNSTNFGRFVLFMILMSFAINLASPFFAVYVLQDLHYNYIEYTVFTLIGTLVSFLFVTYWGAKADRMGNKAIFTTTAMVMPIMPLLWLFTRDFYLITLIQAFGNFAFAGLALSASNFVYDAIPSERRTKAISYFNVLNGLAIFAGASIGGLILSAIPLYAFMFSSKFHELFIISSVVRLAVVLAFFRAVREVRIVDEDSSREGERALFVRLIIIDPMRTVVDHTITNVGSGVHSVMGVGKAVGKAGITAVDAARKRVDYTKYTKKRKKRLG